MHTIDVNGIALNCVLGGQPDGAPLVFINSLGSDLRIWDGVAARLAGRYRLVRYDKRGHGLSDCPPAPYTIRDHTEDLIGLLDALEIEQATLVGVSVGGMIALDAAAAWPGRVQALAVCDTAAKIGTAEMWNTRIDALRRHGMPHLGDAILERWLSPAFAARFPAAYRTYYNMLVRTPVEGYTGTCEAIRDADLTEAVRTIQTHALVLCGAEDKATPPELTRTLLDLLPHATYHEIAQAAHLPCVEQPAETAAQIRVFLEAQAATVAESKFDQGMRVRRAVLGDAHVERAAANVTPFDADFQQFITETAWGAVWARPGLDRKTRHLLTIGILAALGKEELALHLRATQNTGVTAEEVKEVLMQVAVYAGVPAANSAISLAKKIYAELSADG